MSKSIVKSSNLLGKIAFSRFYHSEFVYESGNVYFTQEFMRYTF